MGISIIPYIVLCIETQILGTVTKDDHSTFDGTSIISIDTR